jgi:hypothetical protein
MCSLVIVFNVSSLLIISNAVPNAFPNHLCNIKLLLTELVHAGHASNVTLTTFLASATGRLIQLISLLLPQRLVHTDDAAVIRHHAVDLTFDIRGLSPDTTRTSEELDLFTKLADEVLTTVVPGPGCVGELIRGLATEVFVP